MSKDLQIVTVENSTIRYKFLKSPKSVSGVQNLIQRIVKILLTEKGSNAFDPEFGSVFYSIVKNLTVDEVENAKNAISIILKDIVDTLKNTQIEMPYLDDSELVEDIILLESEFDYVLHTWYIKLLVITKDKAEVELEIY